MPAAFSRYSKEHPIDPITLITLAFIVVLVVVLVVRGKGRRKAEQATYEQWLSSEAASGVADTSFETWKANWASEYHAAATLEADRVKAAKGLATDERRVQEQAKRIKEWQRAYEIANGTPPPPGSAPAFLSVNQTNHTNTLAILSLIFGIGGGVLGIIFGHLALSQIAKTGENGRGLAIAGLVCGYLGLAAIAGILLFVYGRH